MGRSVLFCLVLAEILLVQSMAARSDGSELNPPKVTVRTVDVATAPGITIADPPSSGAGEAKSSSEGQAEMSGAQAPEIRRMGKHHSSDRSVAGGGVIIGGLFTAIFAAVYCYIRVTRRREGEK